MRRRSVGPSIHRSIMPSLRRLLGTSCTKYSALFEFQQVLQQILRGEGVEILLSKVVQELFSIFFGGSMRLKRHGPRLRAIHNSSFFLPFLHFSSKEKTRPMGQRCVLCVVHVVLCVLASVQNCARVFYLDFFVASCFGIDAERVR